MDNDKNILDTPNRYNIGLGILFSAIAYFFGYLKKALYLSLLNVSVSPFDIYEPLNFYTTGLLFVISALSLPALFILLGFILKKVLNKCLKTDVCIKHIFVISLIPLLICTSFFVYVIEASATTPYFFFISYLLPIPILDNSYTLCGILICSWALIIALIFIGYYICGNTREVTFFKSNIFRMLIISAWIILLFYTQFTEPLFKISGVAPQNDNSNNEVYFSWVTTNTPLDNSIKGEDSLYYTRCAILNFRDGSYYIVTVALSGYFDKKEQYSFNVVPKENVIGLTQQNYLFSSKKRRSSENDRLCNFLKGLDEKNHRVFHDIKLHHSNNETYFNDIVISNKAIFNILPSHQAGNLSVNDAGNILMEKGASKIGIIFDAQWDLENRKDALVDILGLKYPIINLIVLTDETATIENENKSPYKIIKFDMLNYYIDHYDGPSLIDVESVTEQINGYIAKPTSNL